MGIDCQLWRARIGLFRHHGKSSLFSHPGRSRDGGPCLHGALTIGFLTLCALLVIGGVEINPGPEFQCLKCLSAPKFSTLGQCVLHQKCHINDRNFMFTCQWPSCGLKFVSYNALDLHVRYYHAQVREVPQVATVPRPCNVPGCEMVFPSWKLLCQHLMTYHQDGQKTGIQCPFKSICGSSNYFPLQSFRTHLSQKHPGWKTCVETPAPTGRTADHHLFYNTDSVDVSVNMDMGDENIEDTGMDDNDSNESVHESEPNVSRPLDENKMYRMKEEFYRSLAMFYLKLESKLLVPISTIQVIADSLSSLTEMSLIIQREAMSEELEDLNLPPDVKTRVMNNVLSSDCMFAGHHRDVAGPSMTTNALRKAYYKTHFYYVKPKEINLSKDPEKPRCIYYIPIKKTLARELSDPEIEAEVEESWSRESEDGILGDYKDGSLYKARKEKSAGEKTIELLVFQDAFSPTKDLSSVANTYQICGMYMTIGNLRPHLRSKIDCMRLILLIPDFKAMFADYRLLFFRKVVDALKRLEVSGIKFKGEQVRVQLHFLIGDNKGQHEIGGFIQAFSSEYFCRYCPMSKTEILLEPWKVGPLRTAASYEEFSKLVPADRATYKGISRPEWQSPFNELKDFHVCDPALCPCLGHDVYEGVINYDLSLMIKYFVQEKWFTYPELNRRIKNFRYVGHDSGNKPAPVRYDKKKKNQKKTATKKSKETKLGGHAVQNWTLLRLLPLILDEDLIQNTDDRYWRLYLLLKEITNYLSAPYLSMEQLSLLKTLIEDYSQERQEILGDGKPKHHYIAHFPDLIEIMGPLIAVMTLRFESFHQFFKRAALMGHNFINIGLLLIRKYCLYLAYMSSGSPIKRGIEVSEPGISVRLQMEVDFDASLQNALESRGITDRASLMVKIRVDDVEFKKNNWLLLGNQNDDEIIIGQIKWVVLDGSSVFLILEEHLSSSVPHYGLYVVNSENLRLSCVPVKVIKYPMPQSIYQWGNYGMCFSLKHTLAHNAPPCHERI